MPAISVSLLDEFLSLFRKPTPEGMAHKLLEQHQRALIEAHYNKDYYAKIVEFHEMRIRSLSMSLKKGNTYD